MDVRTYVGRGASGRCHWSAPVTWLLPRERAWYTQRPPMAPRTSRLLSGTICRWYARSISCLYADFCMDMTGFFSKVVWSCFKKLYRCHPRVNGWHSVCATVHRMISVAAHLFLTELLTYTDILVFSMWLLECTYVQHVIGALHYTLRPEPTVGVNHKVCSDAWPVRRQTYSYLRSFGASMPLHYY